VKRGKRESRWIEAWERQNPWVDIDAGVVPAVAKGDDEGDICIASTSV